jgi:hypothetical protein
MMEAAERWAGAEYEQLANEFTPIPPAAGERGEGMNNADLNIGAAVEWLALNIPEGQTITITAKAATYSTHDLPRQDFGPPPAPAAAGEAVSR